MKADNLIEGVYMYNIEYVPLHLVLSSRRRGCLPDYQCNKYCMNARENDSMPNIFQQNICLSDDIICAGAVSMHARVQ